MAKSKAKKPILVKVGAHFINPQDVSRIRRIELKKSRSESERIMYVVDFISSPNAEYTCWVNKDDIGILLEQFNIITTD